MNRRIIKSILIRKHTEWCKSIKDENVRKMVEKNSIITGGAIVSMLTKEKVNDFDIYFTDFETTKAVTMYYVKEFNRLHPIKVDPKLPPENQKTKQPFVVIEEDRVRIRIKSAGIIGENTDENQYQYFEQRPIEEGEEYITQSLAETLTEADQLDGEKIEDDKKEKYRPVFLTDNAITLSNKIQIVIRFYGDPEKIHSNYDFIHCTCYWTSKEKSLVLPATALESIITKQLYYHGSKYPVCSFIRCRKFIKKGWYINAGQMLKICLQISELNLTDIKVLEDQLTGVDTAYFIQVLNQLKDRQAKNPDFHVDMPYLVSIIDRMFQ